MEISHLIESLDSLWFFSNPFSFPKTTPSHQSDENSLLTKGEPSKVIITPSVQKESPSPKSINPICSKCGVPKEEDKRRRYVRSKRIIVGEPVDLVDEINYCFEDNGLLTDSEGEDNSWSCNYVLKLPPLDLDDPMTVKEHLKFWAHSVACTVR